MLRSLSKLKEAVFQVVSPRMISVPIHWVGRSVLCAGEHCPACQLRMPRMVHYVGACVREQVCTLEVCGSVASIIANSWGALGVSTPCGLKFWLVRDNCRDQWTLKETAPRPVARVVSEWEVVRDVALALRLPGPGDGEVYRTWYHRVSPPQALVLAKTQLFS